MEGPVFSDLCINFRAETNSVEAPVFSDFHPTPDPPDLQPWLFYASLCLRTPRHLHPDFVAILRRVDIFDLNS